MACLLTPNTLADGCRTLALVPKSTILLMPCS